MQITVLVENTSVHPACKPAHGLSLWIETAHRRLLMDAGPSDVLIENACALGVDLSQAEALFLSHGHYDHADGIPAFAALNPHAPIYLHRTAADPYYSGSPEDGSLHYIGVDPEIARLPQLRWVDGEAVINEEAKLFSGITGRKNWPESNLRLTQKHGDRFIQDSFAHEQCLVITENGKSVLFSGCAHNGVLNILDRYQTLYGAAPDAVISGFHMKKSAGYTPAEEATIRSTARELQQWPCAFYTCHCTGLPAFQMMKEIMGPQLQYLACGQRLLL